MWVDRLSLWIAWCSDILFPYVKQKEVHDLEHTSTETDSVRMRMNGGLQSVSWFASFCLKTGFQGSPVTLSNITCFSYIVAFVYVSACRLFLVKAALRCCNILRERLEPVRAKMPDADWKTLCLNAQKFKVDLSAHATLVSISNSEARYWSSQMLV